jgi:hypothetical protein
MGARSLVKNFLTTPAIAKPLYSAMFFSYSPSHSFDSSSIISYYYSIDPDFLNIPSSSSNPAFPLRDFTKIDRATGMPFASSFYIALRIHAG